jgi:hypothetical protein
MLKDLLMSLLEIFSGCVGTVKLPGSDELNGSLTTYAKFWT